MSKILVVISSDWHWWHTPPAMRSGEPDWMGAMARPLRQMVEFTESECEVDSLWLMGGDMFDRFNPPPEAVNRLIEEIPYHRNVVAIPGQHDLENHLVENIEKTGFWTVYNSSGIYYNHAKNGLTYCDADKEVYCLPWDGKVEDVKFGNDYGRKRILVWHKYVWKDTDTRFQSDDELEEGKLVGSKLAEQLQEFDLAVFGDNHIPFTCKVGRCQVVNSGTLCRRKRNELDYETSFWTWHEDGHVERHRFDVSKDIVDLGIQTRKADGESEFVKGLNEDSEADFDFIGRIRQAVESDEPKKEIFERIFKTYEGAM